MAYGYQRPRQALGVVFNQVEAGGPLASIDPEGRSIGELSLCQFIPLKPLDGPVRHMFRSIVSLLMERN